jgi:hypothetical protein
LSDTSYRDEARKRSHRRWISIAGHCLSVDKKKADLDIIPLEVNDRASRIKQVISSMISGLSKAIME